MRLSRRLLLWCVAIAWLVYTLLSDPMLATWGAGSESMVIIGFVLLWLGTLWFRIDLTRHTVASLSEAKECGALEQILVTPLDEKQFRRGHFRAMARFWFVPLMVLLAAPISMKDDKSLPAEKLSPEPVM